MNFFFINEGNGISTILFFIQPSGKKQNKNKTTTKLLFFDTHADTFRSQQISVCVGGGGGGTKQNNSTP